MALRHALLLLAALGAGCVEPLREPERWLSVYARDAGAEGCDAPALVLRSRVLCASTICHGASQPAAGLSFLEPDLSSLWGRPASTTAEDAQCADMGLILDPARPEQSLLLTKLDAATAPCGEVMPVEQRLSDDERACIRAWVLAHAPEAP